MGKDFSFYHVFETNFTEHNKIWGQQKRFAVNCPSMPHRVCGPGQTVARKSSNGGFHISEGGLDILKIYD